MTTAMTAHRLSKAIHLNDENNNGDKGGTTTRRDDDDDDEEEDADADADDDDNVHEGGTMSFNRKIGLLTWRQAMARLAWEEKEVEGK